MYYETQQNRDGTSLYEDESGNWVRKDARMQTVERGQALPAAEVAKENSDASETQSVPR